MRQFLPTPLGIPMGQGVKLVVTDGFESTGACLQPLLSWASSPRCLSAGSGHPGNTQRSGEAGQVPGPSMGDSGSQRLRPTRPGRTGWVEDVLSVFCPVVIQGFADGPSPGDRGREALSAAGWEWGVGRTGRAGRDLVTRGHICCTLFPFGSGHRGGMGIRERTSVAL